MPAKKIVLSDDAVLLTILRNSFFQREGFQMILVQDGQTGFQAVEVEEPTLAVFDIVQLGEQALECCRKIKNDPLLAETPVLLLLPEKAVEDMAADLIKLYAERKAQPGYAFGEDTVWLKQMEASFPFEETRDQLRAIKEVKADMAQSKVMDRLVCGDVGFGKTEVAMRAAFKAIENGKQVAVLVPTTILCQQHFQTFSERMADFPMRVGMLSRFRSKKELHCRQNSGSSSNTIKNGG